MSEENDPKSTADKQLSAAPAQKKARPVPNKKKRPVPTGANKKQAIAAPVSKKKKKAEQSQIGNEELGKLGSVVVRNEFYRDGYRSILRLAVIQALVMVAMVAIMFHVVNIHQPENRYFATTEDGRLIPMLPLNQPNLSTPALLSWVAQASTEVMTFGFNDYRRRLQEASRNFTRLGWLSFTEALQKSRIIEVVERNQQVLTAAPRGAPILQSEGFAAGRYQWVVQIPMVLTYQSGTKTRNDRLLVTLVVVRVPRLESPNGIGIEQWIAVPG